MLRSLAAHPTCRERRLIAVAASLIWTLSATASHAATAGELLEKAIYTEETVGDVDGAIQLYEQVLAVAKDASQAAAQAQYRLGLCYEKQKKAELAAVAFQAVIDNFPEQQELVAEARKHIPSEPLLLPIPWVSGERLHMTMKLATGMDVGTMINMVDEVEQDGRPMWQCSTLGLVTVNGSISYSRVLCDKESFAPIQSLWRHSLLGEATASYSDSRVNISTVGKDDPTSLPLAAHVWDNEQGVELFRRLPLKVGYKTKITVLSSLGGQNIPLSLEVPQVETIDVPAGKFECFKLVLNIGQTFWISTDEHRYVTRFEAGGVIANLARVEQQQPGETVEVRHDGLFVSLPKGWYAYTPTEPSNRQFTRTYLLDPQGLAITEITSGPRSELKEDEQASSRAWTESYIKQAKQRITDFKVRDPGVFDMQIGGQTAAAMIADHQEGTRPLTVFGAALFNKDSAINFRMRVQADKFDELRGDFESILKNLTLK